MSAEEPTALDLDNLNEELKTQCTKAYFDLIEEDLRKEPPVTEHVKSVITDIVTALKRFVPSRTDLHDEIERGIPHDTVDATTMHVIVTQLVHWIEQFQPPAYDAVTKQWVQTFQSTTDYPAFLSTFLKEYLEHTEKVYKEVWECRVRLTKGEDMVPPARRKKVEGSNGVPTNMRTGTRP